MKAKKLFNRARFLSLKKKKKNLPRIETPDNVVSLLNISYDLL